MDDSRVCNLYVPVSKGGSSSCGVASLGGRSRDLAGDTDSPSPSALRATYSAGDVAGACSDHSGGEDSSVPRPSSTDECSTSILTCFPGSCPDDASCGCRRRAGAAFSSPNCYCCPPSAKDSCATASSLLSSRL